MNKYPFVYLLRDNKYNQIDKFLEENKDKLNCTVEIISKEEVSKLNNMYDPNYHILVTYGPDDKEYNSLVSKIIPRRISS